MSILLLIISMQFVSCISVKVPLGPVDKLKDLKFSQPEKPFVELSSEDADHSWISEATGNTISILSECQESRLKPKDVAADTLAAIEQPKIIKSESTKISSHPAHEITATGVVDQHAIKITILSLRTKECFVTLTYGGLLKNYDTESSHYNRLRDSVAVP